MGIRGPLCFFDCIPQGYLSVLEPDGSIADRGAGTGNPTGGGSKQSSARGGSHVAPKQEDRALCKQEALRVSLVGTEVHQSS